MKVEEIEQLEQVDEIFLRKLLEAGRCCPKDMSYLETDSWPIRYIIMSRRLMFLHYLLNEEKESLVYKVLQKQIKHPVKNYQIFAVKENIDELEIGLDLVNIKELSIERFETFLDERIEKKVLEYHNEKK